MIPIDRKSQRIGQHSQIGTAADRPPRRYMIPVFVGSMTITTIVVLAAAIAQPRQ
jgi:hypothetical protein